MGTRAKVEIDRMIEDGLALYGKGDLDGALLVWEEALSEDPENEQANSYVDYVRMHYELLTGGEQAADGDAGDVGYGIGGDEEPEYQIEIVAGQIQPVAPPPMFMDPLDEGWFFDDEPHLQAQGVVSGEFTVSAEREIVMEADDPGPSFDDATSEYPSGARRHAVSTGEFRTKADEVTPGLVADSSPEIGFGTQVTDVRKRDMGFVQATGDQRVKRKSVPPDSRTRPETAPPIEPPAVAAPPSMPPPVDVPVEPVLVRPRRASVPPELKMTLRTPTATPVDGTRRIQPEAMGWSSVDNSHTIDDISGYRDAIAAAPAPAPEAPVAPIPARAATPEPVLMTPQLAAVLADVMAGVEEIASAPVIVPITAASPAPIVAEPEAAPVAASVALPETAPTPETEAAPDVNVANVANDAPAVDETIQTAPAPKIAPLDLEDHAELPSMPAPTVDLAAYGFGGDTVSTAGLAIAVSSDDIELSAAGPGTMALPVSSTRTRELSRSEQFADLQLGQIAFGSAGASSEPALDLVSPRAQTQDLERVPTTRIPTRAFGSRTEDPMISAPTRELGLRPPAASRTSSEDEPTGTRSPIVASYGAEPSGTPDGTRADVVLPFDPIDARSAQILDDIDEDAPQGEPREDRTRRRITALLDRAAEWNRHGEHDRAVAAVDLALSEDPSSALAQKLVHRNRDAIMTAFQQYLGDLDRQPALARPLHELASAPISPRAAFLLSRIDGTLSLDEILDVSGMPRLEAYRYLCQLFLRGILR